MLVKSPFLQKQKGVQFKTPFKLDQVTFSTPEEELLFSPKVLALDGCFSRENPIPRSG